jgi:hypothetical protein
MMSKYELERKSLKESAEVQRDIRDMDSWLEKHGDKNPRQITSVELLRLMAYSKRLVKNIKGELDD